MTIFVPAVEEAVAMARDIAERHKAMRAEGTGVQKTLDALKEIAGGMRTLIVPAREDDDEIIDARIRQLMDVPIDVLDEGLGAGPGLRDLGRALAALQHSLQLSERQLATEREAVKLGQSIPRNVLDAQQGLANARLALQSALIDYREAIAGYQSSLGILLDRYRSALPPRVVDALRDDVSLEDD